MERSEYNQFQLHQELEMSDLMKLYNKHNNEHNYNCNYNYNNNDNNNYSNGGTANASDVIIEGLTFSKAQIQRSLDVLEKWGMRWTWTTSIFIM